VTGFVGFGLWLGLVGAALAIVGGLMANYKARQARAGWGTH
jgi:hypothetical protein